jgi:hypothetical protein
MIGAAITPAVGGFLFRHYSPMSVWHFNLVNEAIKVSNIKDLLSLSNGMQ